MEQLDIFISVGGTATPDQETFVRAVEDRLRSEGFVPHSVGRNTFGVSAPLKTITELMDKCAGTIVIALERTYFPRGFDKRGGPDERSLTEVKLPTPWNQIESAMAYCRGQPMMLIIESGLKGEGFLEQGFDWYVQRMQPIPASLTTLVFNGVLADWKSKVSKYSSTRKEVAGSKTKISLTELTIGELISGMKPSQLWSILTAIAVMVGGAFTLGDKLGAYYQSTDINHSPDSKSKSIDSSTPTPSLGTIPIATMDHLTFETAYISPNEGIVTAHGSVTGSDQFDIYGYVLLNGEYTTRKDQTTRGQNRDISFLFTVHSNEVWMVHLNVRPPNGINPNSYVSWAPVP